MFKFFCLGLVSVGLALAVPNDVVAKDKPAKAQNPGKGNKAQNPGQGNKAKGDNPGKGPKAVPPGQIKRYTRGAKLPADVKWEDIEDLSKWKLPPPGQGNRYIKVDNEILKISKDTQTVIDAVGIVGDLLK